jgi:predicted membrane protein
MSDFDPRQFRDDLTEDIHQRINRQMFRHRRRHRRRSGAFGVIAGTTILLVGVLFLLENFGLIHVQRAWQYWPAILIALGVARTIEPQRPGGRIWGGVIAIAGVILLLGNLNVINQNVWRVTWPLLLIGAGLSMLYRTARRRRRMDDPGNPPDDQPPTGSPPLPPRGSEPGHLDEWAVFGGSRKRLDSQDFKGGDAFAMFGGVELDLRSAAITQDEVVIEASALFGGVDIQVPESWNVRVDGHGIFGGYDDQTAHAVPESARPRVVITGNAVFGGVVVKN